MGDCSSEVSGTAKVGDTESSSAQAKQKPNKRLYQVGKIANDINAPKFCLTGRLQEIMIDKVDLAGINGKLFVLPRDISIAINWHNGEVSRRHST